ncbi:peptidoglycan-binding protein [Spongiactinospora sp. TRM90649]|uniref:peptidoglycan-binding protein n=1 Tax=Spongiactinospora sp. TRM90649 TaxID=3031114 RepID=UPI0023F6A0AC|nr:peptidoglycan-binding protein [Spongiactinospora sp. TRM90649]MDF5755420.1 peptidoglycan-binding protein [Spongiactinospora sp. TRM90649]
MRRKGSLLAGVAAVAVLGGGGVAALNAYRAEGTGATPTAAPLPATAEITREDLVDSQSVGGRLTYSGEREVAYNGSGTVTAVPAEGKVIKRGGALLKVDRRPMVLMYGKVPLYRELNSGVTDGPDVEQLERNLRALGYGDDLTVDEDFTYATRLAVQEWQEDRGLPETGSVDASQVVFLDGPVRVASVAVQVGQRTGGGRALNVTGTSRIVQVELDTSDQGLARKGAKVSIELPGGKTVKGKIVRVGTVAQTRSEQEGGGSTIDVEISLGGKGTGRLDQAPVSVSMESERAEDVLTVPVEALLALREGGFGVELVEGGATRLVGVKTGAYGGGRVEISGDGLDAGMKVGVPRT